MLRIVRFLIAIPLVLPLFISGCHTQSSESAEFASAKAVETAWLVEMDSLVDAVDSLRASAMRATPDSAAAVRAQFVAARRAYKRVEYLVEHFTPTTAEGINGPVLPKMAEDDPNQVEKPPEGFQVVEEYLFPELALDDREGLQGALDVLAANVRRARYNAKATPLTDAAVIDAARMQLVRLTTLALAGFDSPVAQHALEESAESLDALAGALEVYLPALRTADPAVADSLVAQFARASSTLRAAHPAGFEQFDQLSFIVDHSEPIGVTLLAMQSALGVNVRDEQRVWRPSTSSPFAVGAIDAAAFAPRPLAAETPAQVALGRRLFFDPVLSVNGARSCATCHQPSLGFADSARVSFVATHNRDAVVRNTPTVINAGLQGASFADLRTTFLEDQVADVVSNVDEMHGSLESATAAVSGAPGYPAAFASAFGDETPNGTPVTSARLKRALAAYMRSLEALDSRFDRYVRGDRSVLTREERDGFNVFMGKGKCGTCHFAPLFNGVVPPLYAKTESEVLGVPDRVTWKNARVDPDVGRARITRLPIHQHSFKTPTLRNIALTAPYMHNGVYRTLEDVVDFYDAGGGAGIGIELPYQTLPPDSLRLSAYDKRALVSFMRALTDTTSIPEMRRVPAAVAFRR